MSKEKGLHTTHSNKFILMQDFFPLNLSRCLHYFTVPKVTNYRVSCRFSINFLVLPDGTKFSCEDLLKILLFQLRFFNTMFTIDKVWQPMNKVTLKANQRS